MTNYYQPEIETMPVDKIQALQSERLAEQVKFVYDNVKFYHDKMDEAGVKPEDVKGIEDLHKLPFINKDDLRDQYPCGGILHAGGYRCVGRVLCACNCGGGRY